MIQHVGGEMYLITLQGIMHRLGDLKELLISMDHFPFDIQP
jgi:hypothetical protein